MAKYAAAKLPQPSTAEREAQQLVDQRLKRFLRFVPKALALWPAIAPGVGRKGLEKPTKSSNPAVGALSVAEVRHSGANSGGSSSDPGTPAVPRGPRPCRARVDLAENTLALLLVPLAMPG